MKMSQAADYPAPTHDSYYEMRNQINQLQHSSAQHQTLEDALKAQIKQLHVSQLHYQRDQDLIEHERREMNKFLKFLAKVNTKLRKHILSLPACKPLKQVNVL